MEKVKNGKNLKEKVLFLMCLGALTGNMSTEVYAQENPEYNIKDYSTLIGEKVSEVFNKTPENDRMNIEVNISENGDTPIEVEKILITPGKTPNGWRTKINLDINNIVKISNTPIREKETASIYVDNDVYTTELNTSFNNHVFIKSSDNLISGLKNYALYSNSSISSGGGATASIIVGSRENNYKIQIIGNLGVQNEEELYKDTLQEGYKNNNSSTIELNLNNRDSFFAGKMLSEKVKQNKESDSKIWLEGNEKISLNLKNGATWYAHNSNGIDSYNIR